MTNSSPTVAVQSGSEERRSAVLDAALAVFMRYGYAKTSMEDVAAAARISRPGLYFLFASKGALFGAAVTRAIERDLAAAEEALVATGRPISERVLDAFEHWAGRYIGPLGDAPSLVESNPDLVGPIAVSAPDRFFRILVDALETEGTTGDPRAVARTLVSISIGLKHQVKIRERYTDRMREATILLLPRAQAPSTSAG